MSPISCGRHKALTNEREFVLVGSQAALVGLAGLPACPAACSFAALPPWAKGGARSAGSRTLPVLTHGKGGSDCACGDPVSCSVRDTNAAVEIPQSELVNALAPLFTFAKDTGKC